MSASLLDDVAPRQMSAPAPRESELARRIHPPMPADRGTSWLVALAVTAFGAMLRWPDLGTPHAFSFDETYYAKDGLSLIRFGYEQSTISGANDVILASNGDWRTLKVFTGDPEFVVHPPVGKWVIGAGEYLFGATPFGWRFGVAVLGTLAVLLMVRIGRRLTRSTLWGAVAGLLLAVDGMAIVHSRTALLDPVLMFWVLVAFGALLLDRDRTRARLAEQVVGYDDDLDALRSLGSGVGPRLGGRPWRWVAGVSLGLACGTKWSGVWYVAAFALLTVLWDSGLRRRIGVPHAFTTTLWRSAPAAVLPMVVVPAVVYLGTWAGWLLTDGGYDRNWAADNPAVGLAALVPAALRSLWHYHAEALSFHRNLTTPHSYQSNPWGWPIMARPTSYYYQTSAMGDPGCNSFKCSAEVVALGNPIVWWAGLLALIHQGWRWAARRDWRSGAVVAGFVAGWAPWLLFQGRTIFTFYALVFLPFTVLALTMSLGTVVGPETASPNRRTVGAAVAGAIVLAAVACAWFFAPVWTGQVIPYTQWQMRMWFPTWV